MNRKEILKANILSLLSGEKKPHEIYPECVCKIGYGEENIFVVNGKEVSKEKFDRAAANLNGDSFTITYEGKKYED